MANLSSLNYIRRHPERLANALLSDPVAVWDTWRDKRAQRREAGRPPYCAEADPGWERKLVAALGADGDEIPGAQFRDLWFSVVDDVRGKGIDVGPESYVGFNDGDAALVRAVWLIVRHTKAAKAIETGVAHGFTSRFILEAMAANGCGHLWSIDRPPFDEAMRKRVGLAVPAILHNRWTLIRKSSRRALPGLVRELRDIDLFIHDSLHTERNVHFELECVWPWLRPGAFLVVDDIDSNWGFDAFARRRPHLDVIVCEADPVRPDTRRFNQKGLFAIVRKDPGLSG